MAGNFEKEVEQLCQRIQNTPIESWTVRNETLMQLKNVVETYGGHGPASEMFTTGVFRKMKEPIKSMISDLRSSNVRDCCEFLKALSRVSGDSMRHLLRDILQTVIEQIKIPNKVTSGYVDECIREIIYHTTYKPAIAMFAAEVTTSRNKAAREFCAEYLKLTMECWRGLDKEAETFKSAILSGLEDASEKVRETSRVSYLVFIRVFPSRAESVKSSVRPATLAQLEKAENDLAEQAEYQEQEELLVGVSVDATEDTASVDLATQRNDGQPAHLLRPSSGSNLSVNSLVSHDEHQPSDLAIGQRVLCGKAVDTPGTIRFVGLTQFASGYWVGIELDAPFGKNDGSVKGETYFTCAENHGLFVRPSQIRILADDNPQEHALSKAHRAHKMYITRMVLNLDQALKLAEQFDAKIKTGNSQVCDAELSTYLTDVKALQEQYQSFSDELAKELAAIRSATNA